MRSIIVAASLLVASTQSNFAADWSCWRGPDGLGVSAEKNLPIRWSKDEGIAWKVALPGKGVSSPVIIGDRVYLTAQTADTGLHVLALDRLRGSAVWDREIGRGKLKSHDLHNMATPTPVTDGRHIWALFGTGDLVCLDADGQEVWKRNLVKEDGEYKTNHGYGTSPMLLEGRLYVACMHQGSSYFLALDAKTGSSVWKKTRDLGPADESRDSYSSPIFVRSGGATQIVLAGAEAVNAYEPRTGEVIWTIGGFRVPHPYGRTISGPTAGDGLVINVASGFQNRGYTVAINPSGHGELSESHKVWTQNKFSPDCPTPVIYGGKVFMIRDDGMASCLDLKTGEPHWQERLFSANVKVSPVAGDGKIYFLSGQAQCAVVKASPQFEVLAKSDFNEATLSTPAISHGQIFVRTEAGLYCAGK